MRKLDLAVLLLALAVFILPVRVATPCHMPQHLRMIEPMLTPAQVALMAHGGANITQMPYRLDAATACVDGMADIFPCRDIDLLAHLPLSQIGGGAGNDLWGWTDPLTGAEYALVGRTNGTSFVDVTDPENPVYLGNLPSHTASSTWRDIKIYKDHAFVVADFAGSHGIQIFDLTELRSVVNPPMWFSETSHYAGFDRAHNIAINVDTGFGYAVGTETCGGGLHMIDLVDPTNPTAAGCFSADGYTHDAQCVIYQGPDVDYQGREICFASNEDSVTIVDVTDKGNPTQLARATYPNSGYTHQGWLTEDHRYFVHDDELDEMFFLHNTKTYTWDITDLDQPSLAGTHLADGSAIDHNQYVRGQFTYQANYRRGLRILSLDDPATGSLSEIAYFDSYPDGNGLAFEGAWSVYPFFESGIVMVSDINRGLFILQPRLKTLTASGSCPGSFDVAVTGMTPGGQAMVLAGDAAGDGEVPIGACNGTTTGLADPTPVGALTIDGDGEAGFQGQMPASRCGQRIQMVDLASCGISNVTALP